jgi:hypothetical protein
MYVTLSHDMTISKEEKYAQLERILRGRALHGAENLRAFLRYVVDKSIAQQEHLLKEYAIATEVFGRRSAYDPKVDSVVRVQASRLRTKLLEYYTTEGKDDPLLIELPKGQYVPVFSYAQKPFNGALKSPAEDFAASEVREWQRAAPLWGSFLRSSEPVLLVFSNTVFHGNYQEGMRLFNSLNVIESGNAPALSQGISYPGQANAQPAAVDHYTGIGEVMGVHYLGDFFARLHQPCRVKRSLLLNWDDAKAENIVVLGSPAENFFLQDLPQQQDFVFRWIKDEQQRNVNAIANTAPQPGEQELYLAKQFGASPSQISEDYAVVSLLRGLSEENRLLILAGINTFGTQAAAEYVTRPEYLKDLVTHLNTAAPDEPPQLPAYFQILLKVKVNGGVPIHVSYVTHHVLSQ